MNKQMVPAFKAVAFDIDDTLCPTSFFVKALARPAAIREMKAKGLFYQEEKLLNMLQSIVKEKGSNYPYHFNVLVERLEVPEERVPLIVAAAVQAYHSSKRELKPFPGVEYIFSQLSNERVPFFIISEGVPVKQWDKLLLMKLHVFFYGREDDVFILSKKDVEAYRYVLRKIHEKYGLESHEVLMVGNSPEKDILPAKEVGMTTVRARLCEWDKHYNADCEADYEISDFYQLVKILFTQQPSSHLLQAEPLR